LGQKKLAEYVVELVFGKKEIENVHKITEILFSKENKLNLLKQLNNEEKIALKGATGGVEIDKNEWKILELCSLSGLTESN